MALRSVARPSEPSIHDRLELYQLTPRERSVVYLLLRGCSNKEIAGRCRIAVQTVKDHLRHIYGKTGVHQRTALFALLLETAQDLDRNFRVELPLGPKA